MKSTIKKLDKKYKMYVEKAYNLMFTSPAESDYYAFEANKVLSKMLMREKTDTSKLIL